MYRGDAPLSARPFGGVRLPGCYQYVAYIDKNRHNSDKKCRSMSIFAMTKKCYPQNEISIYILIRIKIIIENENKRRLILIRIIIRIIIDIKMCMRIIIIILIRIIIIIKISLDTMP